MQRKDKDAVNNANSTHLYYNHKNLKLIPKFDLTKVYVFYLHNNAIKKIENLISNSLIHLYLQSNEISEIENLELVPNIKKLYLGNNEISVVEKLTNLVCLEELHIEKQRLSMNMSICFDPRSIISISKSLQVLNISDNGIESLSALAPLRHLKSICASNNKIHDLDELCEILKSWFYLRDAWFDGNPINQMHHYREDIIASTYCLDSLDNKNITAATRNFIKRFENEKLKKSSKPSLNLADFHSNLPRNYPPPIQKAVSADLIRSKMHVLDSLPSDMEFNKKKDHPFTFQRSSKHLQKPNVTNKRITNNPVQFPGSFSYNKR